MNPLTILERNKRVGRPTKIESVEKFESLFWEYVEKECSEVGYYADKEMIKAGSLAGNVVDIDRIPLLTIGMFCLWAGISTSQFDRYVADKDNEFCAIATYVRDFIFANMQTAANHGKANQQIVAMLTGMKARTDITSNDQQVNTVITFEGLE